MNIGIIVHSQTGNTYSVAERIKETLITCGHTVSIEKLTAINDREMDFQNVLLTNIPKIDAYDALVLGAPVRAFSLSPIMKAYLLEIPSLQGKTVECFVTEYFPFPWMGGNQAIKQLKEICESKGAIVLDTGIVNWSSKHRPEQITAIVEKQNEMFLSC
jgi:NAD(P)H dehydrogenase (quinone)